MFIPFVYLLRDIGVPISFQYVIEFYEALEKGLIQDLSRLFLVSRLIFVKRVEHYDLFERAFAAYFLGQTERLQLPHVESILDSKPFQEWLKTAIEQGILPENAIHNIPLDELLERFWETVLKQKEAHHGGSRWIGTGGISPWGHSGRARGGIRVHGISQHKSALKVFGQRRYINYSEKSTLNSDNIRQALSMMKRMIPVGPSTELNIEETIYRTCKNGGEIEFVFEPELKNQIQVMVFLDNGGFSMTPYVRIVKLLFSKIKDQFKDLEFFYFHNCIYGKVYKDIYRTQACSIREIVQKDKNTRIFIVGDANMAPSELFLPYGAIDYHENNSVPGIEWLKLLAQTFPFIVWLNPIPKEYWPYQSSTLEAISQIFRMEEITLHGLKNAVEYLQSREAP